MARLSGLGRVGPWAVRQELIMQGFGPDLDNYADPSLDLERYVHRRTAEWLQHWTARDSETADGVREHGARVREAVLAGIGGLPDRPSGPPPMTVTGVRDLGPGRPRIEMVSYESLPGVRVTANLYRPSPSMDESAGTPGPAVLFACGHSYEAKAADRYHSAALALADAGMTVLAVDPHGQGERVLRTDHDVAAGRGWGVDEHLRTGMSAWWVGHSLMRWMIVDLLAGVDLLVSLPEVDPARIGITGTSGGGTQTAIMMALEPRLAAAAPGTYITGRLEYQRMGQIQDAEQHLLGGTATGVDHADLLIAFAPKPVRVLAVSWDFFAVEGTDTTLERAGRAYGALGASDNLSLTLDDHLHAFSPGLQLAAVEFFSSTFGLAVRPPPSDRGLLAPDQLLATRSGQVIADDPSAVMITDLVTRELDAAEAAPDPDGWLAERVHRNRRRPPRDAVRWIGPESEPHLFWNSEEDLWGAGILLDPQATQQSSDAPPSLTLILLPDGTRTDGADDLLPEAVPGAGPRVVLDLRGQGALTSRQRGVKARTSLRSYDYKLLCDLLWLDDSLAAGRIFDLCRAIDVLTADREFCRRWPGIGSDTPVDLVAVGPVARWHAELAARIEPRIREVRHDGSDLGLAEAVRTATWDETIGNWQGLIPGIASQLDL